LSGRGQSARRSNAGEPLRRIALDVSPLRESRDFRLLMIGQVGLITILFPALDRYVPGPVAGDPSAPLSSAGA
jgi:hypothetical protein